MTDDKDDTEIVDAEIVEEDKPGLADGDWRDEVDLGKGSNLVSLSVVRQGRALIDSLMSSAVKAAAEGDLDKSAYFLRSLGEWAMDRDPDASAPVGHTRTFAVRTRTPH